MKPNISLACKKSPFFPPVKTVLGQFPPRKISPNPSPNHKANPYPNPNRGGGKFSLGLIAWTPVKIKETKNRKQIKNNRRKKK